MRKWPVAMAVVLVAVLLVLSFTPLKYEIHYDTYSINQSQIRITENLTNNGSTLPPELTVNDFTTLGQTGNVNATTGGTVTSGMHLGYSYWAYYNNSMNLVLSVLYVHMDLIGGNVQLAPGTPSHTLKEYRSRYQYTSQVTITLPKNSSDDYTIFAPNNSVNGNASTWYEGVGFYSSLPMLESFYEPAIPHGKTFFSTGLRMGYFFLEPIRMTEHTSGWQYYDLNYSHGDGMDTASYVVASTFSPSSDHVNLTIITSFVLYQNKGLHHGFDIIQKTFVIPIDLSGYRK